jgi:2-polyprenyl-3-methyl-5-hydroxy-6-metoxy-1,4-benzoquinol methylase
VRCNRLTLDLPLCDLPVRNDENERLTEAVRLGGTALGEVTLEPENPDWVKFAQAMMPLMHFPAEIMAIELRKGGEAHKVLDIAASNGAFGIAVAKQNPSAHIYAADWKNVLEVAAKNAQNMGVADRYHLIPGNAFESDFGSGYDLVLIPNFLHHFDPPTCTTFMRRVHAALKPGGRAAIAELVKRLEIRALAGNQFPPRERNKNSSQEYFPQY